MINMQTTTLPLLTADGDYTLWGCYKLTCGYIHENYYWRAESTRSGHESRLQRIIEIAIPNHDSTPIDQYPDSFPTDVRAAMELHGKNGKSDPYESSTLDQFEYLVRVILEVAEAHYLRKRPNGANTLSSHIHFSTSGEPVVRRYLHPEETLALLKQVIPLLKRSGPARLFLIMMACGCRENECCGLNWSMLLKDPDTGICTIKIPQSTQINKRTTKLGGKTANAPREIVVPDLVYNLLVTSRELLLKNWVAAGKPPDQFSNIPLGGTLKDYTKRCMTKDLTDFANELFTKIGMRENDLSALADDLMREHIDRKASGLYTDIEEYRSCTCYLARRDYATSLLALGLRTLERQYSMGHDTGTVVDRRIFTSDFMQERMHRLLRQRPLFNLLSTKRYEIEIGRSLDLQGNAETIIIPPGAGSIGLDISTEEPGDIIEIDIMQDAETLNNLRMSYRVAYCAPVRENDTYSADINVLHFYHQLYKDQIADFAEWIKPYL